MPPDTRASPCSASGTTGSATGFPAAGRVGAEPARGHSHERRGRLGAFAQLCGAAGRLGSDSRRTSDASHSSDRDLRGGTGAERRNQPMAAVWNFAEWCVSKHRVRLLSMAEIDRVSPQTERFDLRSEISFGSPYALPHASAMAELLSRLLAPPPPLKGLITDLDGTLWHGILGEAGAPGVSFTLDSGGVRSVACISNCSNLLRSAGCCLPLQARTTRHWSRTLSPARTCWSSKIDFFRSWQIGDRSPNPFDRSWPPGTSDRKRWLSSTTARWRSKKCELIFLELRTVVFPSEPSKALDLLRDLREWFGKPVILDEDRLRAQSLRQAAAMGTLPGEPTSRETFLSAPSWHLVSAFTRRAGSSSVPIS